MTKECVTDTEVRILIGALEAIELRSRSINQKVQLSALHELLQRRSGEYICPRCGIRQDGEKQNVDF